jgi:hypothetical protein
MVVSGFGGWGGEGKRRNKNFSSSLVRPVGFVLGAYAGVCCGAVIAIEVCALMILFERPRRRPLYARLGAESQVSLLTFFSKA